MKDSTAYIDRKNVTFSGSDTLAFIILPKTPPILLGSLTTFSYSSYRAKKPVNVLGSIINRGVAKGSRILAGTFVFTIINQHWVNDLIDQVPWLKNSCDGVVYSDELPLFDVMIISANEYGKHVSMRIQGINLTDEAGTLSVNDAYTENTFSFIAREIRTFNDKKTIGSDMTYKSHKLFREFEFNTFSKGYTPNTKNKPWKAFSDELEEIKNALVNMDKETVDDIVNNLVDLGNTFDDISNSNPAISDAIWDAITNFYPDGNIDIDDFLTNKLPYISEDEFNNTNSYYTGSVDDVNFYSAPTLQGFTDKVSNGEQIVVFSEHRNTNGDMVFYTDNGWVLKEDLLEVPSVSSSIGEHTGVGTTNMNLDVMVDGFLLDSDDKFIDYPKSYAEFLNNFSILIRTEHIKPQRCVSNIFIGDANGAISNRGSFILSGTTKVSFIDRMDFLLEHKPREIIVVIKEEEYNNFFTIKVIFTGRVLDGS